MCVCYEHTLIELKELLDEAKENIKNINIIISNNYILSKVKENSDGIEKKNKNYEIIDEFEINNEIEGKLKEYTNDIIFINTIIDKNYIILLYILYIFLYTLLRLLYKKCLIIMHYKEIIT